uniref:Uncharacterized protein n=1 Tax=Arundo donax TaxID=35708 RepID=A0A0A9EFB9_ARUDO
MIKLLLLVAQVSGEASESFVQFERWVKMILRMVLAFALKRFREHHFPLKLV